MPAGIWGVFLKRFPNNNVLRKPYPGKPLRANGNRTKLLKNFALLREEFGQGSPVEGK